MGCNCQSTSGVLATAADPCQRVNYTLGMILGVDDFVQEQIFHSAHREAVARLGFGYGTMSGLQASLEPTRSPVQLRVGTGMALAPSGRLIRLNLDQCCTISDWLTANPILTFLRDNHLSEADWIRTRDGLGDGKWVKAWVALTYSEALCADVPIPGEACRTEDKLTAPSRIEDSWNLEITWNRPDQLEEDALRDFFRWVCQIPVNQDATAPTESDLLDEIRRAAAIRLQTPGKVLDDPGFFLEGTPLGTDVYKGQLFRSVLRLWVTELRNVWCAQYCWAPATTDADSLLICGIWIPLVGSSNTTWTIDPTRNLELDQVHRPILLGLNAIQEMVQHLPSQILESSGTLGGDVSGTLSDSKVERLQGTLIAPVTPSNDQILFVQNGKWVPSAPGGDIDGPIQDIHVTGLQGTAIATDTPTNSQILSLQAGKWTPSAIGGDIAGPVSMTTVTGLQGTAIATDTPTNSQILSLQSGKWTPSAIGGDITGPVSTTKVTGLQGTAIATDAPTNDQILSLQAGKWTPSAVGGDIIGPVSATKVVKIQGVNVSQTAPLVDQVLKYDGTSWTPEDAPSSLPSIGRGPDAYDLVAAGTVILENTQQGVMQARLMEGYASTIILLNTSLQAPWQVKINTLTASMNPFIAQFTKIWDPETNPSTDYEVMLIRAPDGPIAYIRSPSGSTNTIIFQYQLFQAAMVTGL